MFERLKSAMHYRKQFLDLLVGVPNYETYVEHMRQCHPGESVKSRDVFFREAQEAKYGCKGGNVTRCC